MWSWKFIKEYYKLDNWREASLLVTVSHEIPLPHMTPEKERVSDWDNALRRPSMIHISIVSILSLLLTSLVFEKLIFTDEQEGSPDVIHPPTCWNCCVISGYGNWIYLSLRGLPTRQRFDEVCLCKNDIKVHWDSNPCLRCNSECSQMQRKPRRKSETARKSEDALSETHCCAQYKNTRKKESGQREGLWFLAWNTC